MKENEEKDLSNFYNSKSNFQIYESTNISNHPFKSEIDPILKTESYYNYLCPKCYKFPFIDFKKDKKYIKFTCSCFNNKKILIKDLLDKSNDYISIKNIQNSFFSLSSSKNLNNENNKKNDEGLLCTKHNYKFEYFCNLS